MNFHDHFSDLPSLTEAFSSLLRASVLAGGGIIVVLALRWCFARRLSPQARCWLWLPVVLLGLLPRLPDLGFGLALEEPSMPAPVVQVKTPVLPEIVVRGELASNLPAAELARTEAPRSMSGSEVVAWCWLAGAVGILAVWLLAYARLWRRARRMREAVPSELAAMLEVCRADMRLRRSPRLLVTGAVDSPAVAGLLRPTVLVPPPLIGELSSMQMRHVLLHEMGHLRRGDLWFHWFSAALVVLHWFNPLFWIAARLFRADREAACDAAVLASADEDRRHAYGSTLLALEARTPVGTAPMLFAGMLGGADMVRQRILDITQHGTRSRTVGWLAAMATFLAAGVLALAAAEPPPASGLPSPKSAAAAPPVAATETDNKLYTRAYKVPPDFLTWSLEPNVPSALPPEQRPNAKQLLEMLGVPMPEGATAAFIPSTSQLIVRNTIAELELIEQIVEARMNTPLVMVHITSRILAFDRADAKDLGLDMFVAPSSVDTLLQSPPQGRSPLLQMTPPGIMAVAGVFTDPQAQAVLSTVDKKLNELQKARVAGQDKDVSARLELYTLPSVTTRSKQKATIAAVREHEFAAEYEKAGADGKTLVPVRMEKKELGITLEIEPVIGPDGLTIDLNLCPEIASFHKWEAHPIKDGQIIRRPVFSEHPRVTTAVTIWDGQTVALGGAMMLPDLTALAVLPDEKAPPSRERTVVLLVTARLIDASGNAVSKDAPKAVADPEIVLPQVELEQASLLDAVKLLTDLGKKHDPANRGVNVVVRHPDAEPPRVTLRLTGVSLSFAISQLAKATGLVVKREGETYVLLPAEK